MVPKHQLIVPSTLLAFATNIRTYQDTKIQRYKATKIHTLTPLTYELFFEIAQKWSCSDSLITADADEIRLSTSSGERCVKAARSPKTRKSVWDEQNREGIKRVTVVTAPNGIFSDLCCLQWYRIVIPTSHTKGI